MTDPTPITLSERRARRRQLASAFLASLDERPVEQHRQDDGDSPAWRMAIRDALVWQRSQVEPRMRSIGRGYRAFDLSPAEVAKPAPVVKAPAPKITRREIRQQQRDAQVKRSMPVRCVTTGKTYTSIAEAARWLMLRNWSGYANHAAAESAVRKSSYKGTKMWPPKAGGALLFERMEKIRHRKLWKKASELQECAA